MIPIVTYTHSNCKDIWSMYFGQIDKYYPTDSYVISNELSNNFNNYKFYTYLESDPYWLQWTKFLEKQTFKYFIYMQEDFILLDYPDINKLNSYINFLDNSNYSFVKLISNDLCGFNNIQDDLYKINSGDDHFFSMQATIWKREDFLKLYTTARVLDFVERPQYTITSRVLNLNGSFCYNNEPKRGTHHFDSNVFPLIATALIRRKWNTLEYKNELEDLSREYNIHMNIRGFYNPYERQPW